MSDKDNQSQDDERFLRAWIEWKDICWINGCSEANKTLLTNIVVGIFMKTLRKYIRKTYTSVSGQSGEQSSMVNCFDSTLMDISSPEMKSGKPWKDSLWLKVAESQDPPLKVINGVLLGTRGYIKDIIKDYIKENYSGHWRYDRQTGKRRFLFDDVASTQEGDGQEEDFSYIFDHYVSEQYSCQVIDYAKRLDLGSCDIPSENIFAEMSRREKIVFLAIAYDVPLSNSELCSFAGVKKSVLSEEKNKLFGQHGHLADLIKKYNNGLLNDEIVMEKIKSLIILEFKMEKTALPFLSMIETKEVKE